MLHLCSHIEASIRKRHINLEYIERQKSVDIRFHFLCGRHDLDPKEVFHDLVRRYFHGPLKPPFNEEKRAEAGLPPDFYWPLADRTPAKS